MKRWVIFVAVILFGISSGSAQVTLTVSPSVVSNTYPGFITLNITGLTNTEQIIVQRWLDANASGTIDPGEPLQEAFKIRDGGAMIIGGVTNVSAPYDSDPVPDEISTRLNFAPPLVFMNVVGRQIFRVVSPTDRFAPVTATLTVTNFPLPQSISGTVYSNGVAGLPDALVVALTLPDQNYIGAALADSGGHYQLNLPTGSYALIGLFPGYYVDQSLSPFVVLTNGVNAVADMSATNSAGPFIAGRIYDAGNSNALGGVLVQINQSGGSLFTVAFTDTNGDYSAPVTSNLWKLKLDAAQLAHRAYIVPEGTAESADTSLGSVSNVNLALPRGNALFYGHVTGTNGAPAVNHILVATDSTNQFKANGFTDTNGDYGVVVLNTTNSPWSIGDSSSNPHASDYIVSGAQNSISNDVFTVENNFFILPITAVISGQLTDNSGHPISGVSIGAFTTVATNNFNTAFVDTDTNGDYAFGAASGNWAVTANAAGGHSLANAGYYDPVPYHSVTIPPTNPVVNIVVYPANLPQFGQPVSVSSSQFNFNLYGANGDTYTVQASTNLASTNWFDLTTISNLPSSPVLIQDFQATNGARFYRAFENP